MTQFNLLPDIKLDYLKAERIRRLVFAVAFIITAASIVLAAGLFTITAFQRSQISSLNADIKKQGGYLSGQTNLNDILTIQNQIQTLSSLHQQEPAVQNLATYLNQIIPTSASLSSLTIDFNADTINMSGSADSLITVNQLVDSLKFATYNVGGAKGNNQAFTNVVLSSFGVSNGISLQGTSYTINLNFDPMLFNNTKSITLTVPTKVTTRSQLDQPTVLFQQANKTGGN